VGKPKAPANTRPHPFPTRAAKAEPQDKAEKVGNEHRARESSDQAGWTSMVRNVPKPRDAGLPLSRGSTGVRNLGELSGANHRGELRGRLKAGRSRADGVREGARPVEQAYSGSQLPKMKRATPV
jgi:hypothetical protein